MMSAQQCRAIASAIWLRTQLPTHTNSTWTNEFACFCASSGALRVIRACFARVSLEGGGKKLPEREVFAPAMDGRGGRPKSSDESNGRNH
jgi:hypothetical protein